MTAPNTHADWTAYCRDELARTQPLLRAYGYTLDEEQPHIGGERYLQQAVTTASGRKLILLGRRTRDDTRVVIKVTSDPAGKEELRHDRQCRQTLRDIQFAYDTFVFPEEFVFAERDGFVLSIQKFIPQPSPFLDRPTSEQFSIALRAFKAQESAHATTFEHLRRVTQTFDCKDADGYIATFADFISSITSHNPAPEVDGDLLTRAHEMLRQHWTILERYSNFLTHVDFVPHNFRVANLPGQAGDTIYLLDSSSLRFGNKYEGWARFCNFMTLYNPELERALVQYVHDNRTADEATTLRMMRIYRLGEIIWFYTQTLAKTDGDLYTLNTKRIALWQTVLRAMVDDTAAPQEVIETYKRERDALRSEEEKRRQKGLH